MKITFLGQLRKVDEYSDIAFIDILNLIISSKDIIELNRNLITGNINMKYGGSLSGHFHWSFLNEYFSLWQRTHYNSHCCFEDKVLEISFINLYLKGISGKTIHLN